MSLPIDNSLTTVRGSQAPTAGVPSDTKSVAYNPSQPSNLNTKVGTKTTNYFNNYLTVPNTVSDSTNDAIMAFFESQTGNRETASVLACAVINTAHQQKVDPLQVLDDFKKLDAGELNGYLTMYLNLSRVNTSLLGITNVPKANKYVTRTILP